MNIKVDLNHSTIEQSIINHYRSQARHKFLAMWDSTLEENNVLESTSLHHTEWIDYPNHISEEYLRFIENTAKEIQESSDYLLVVGTGGSYMGSRAVSELLPGQGNTKLLFLGFDFNERYIKEVLDTIHQKDFSICVISKSGSTMEPMVVSSILIDTLKEKYGEEEAYKRIYIITEDKPSPLHDFGEAKGCKILPIPFNINGRYSVFTAVGLLPLAAHGIDIREFIEGAKLLANKESFPEEGLDYAITRLVLGGYLDNPDGVNKEDKKSIEVFEMFNSYGEYFGNWLRQLFGESEGKNKKGIFPSLLIFNRDLHSVGQFLQDGSQVFYETMIFMGDADPDAEIRVPTNELEPNLSGKTLAQICQSVEQGVLAAHSCGRVPLITIEIESITPKNVGELMYFFLVQSAVSALLIGVDPFNQPGVEAYKSAVRKLLGL